MTTHAQTLALHTVLLRALIQARHETQRGVVHADKLGLAEATMWAHRIAPDMLCLAHQIQVLSDGVRGAMAQLRGDLGHPCAGHVFNRGEELLPVAFTSSDSAGVLLDTAQAELDDTLGLGATMAPPAWGTPRVVTRPGHARRFSFDDFVWAYVLPNALFHASLVHALLRHLGVPLGKADFMGPDVFTVLQSRRA
jgi:uncharacterized protein